MRGDKGALDHQKGQVLSDIFHKTSICCITTQNDPEISGQMPISGRGSLALNTSVFLE